MDYLTTTKNNKNFSNFPSKMLSPHLNLVQIITGLTYMNCYTPAKSDKITEVNFNQLYQSSAKVWVF